MGTFDIHINIGDNNQTVHFYFTHINQGLSLEDQAVDFDKAVKELNRIYKNYGRFATATGVIRLFRAFGFEPTVL